MSFSEHDVKGLVRLFRDERLRPEQLRLHISEVGAGSRAHPPHQHDGVEAIYMLEGEGTLEIGDECNHVGAGEAIVFDPTTLHSLVNSGATPMQYMVVISHP